MSLYNEVLMALLGHTGDIVIIEHTQVIIDPLLTFISDAERAALNQQLQLATSYLLIQRFIQRYDRPFAHADHSSSSSSSSYSSSDPLHSLYRLSLCTGLRPLLSAYSETVLHLASQQHESGGFNLTLLSQTLQPFHALFSSLTLALKRIEDDPLCVGGRLLTLLHQLSLNGWSLLSNFYVELLHQTQQALYHQLSTWMLHGTVLDPQQEFFIIARKHTHETQQALFSHSTLNQRLRQASSSSSPSSSSRSIASSSAEQQLSVRNNSRDFLLRLAMQPAHCPLSLIQRIFSVGQAVIVLRAQAASLSQDLSSSPPFVTFVREMKRLQLDHRFSLQDLEAIVAPLHEHVIARVSRLVLHESRLSLYLEHLHSFYLCTNGDFFNHFFSLTESLSTRRTTESELQAKFEEALQLSALGLSEDTEFVAQTVRLLPHLELTNFVCDSFAPKSLVHAVKGDENLELSRADAMFVCCESARLIGDRSCIALTSSTTDDVGAFWTTRRVNVAHGFETQFLFSAELPSSAPSSSSSPSSPDQPSSKRGFAFVLHNDSMPCLATHQTRYGETFASLHHAISIEFLQHTASVIGGVSSPSREQLIVHSFGSDAASTPLATLTSNWSLFDGQRHAVHIEYKADSSIEEGDAPIGVLSITLDRSETPALTARIELQKLPLERERAYIGFVSATPTLASSLSLLDTRQMRTLLHGWHFQQRDQFAPLSVPDQRSSTAVTASSSAASSLYSPVGNDSMAWTSRLYLSSSWPSLLSFVIPLQSLDLYQHLFHFLFRVLHCQYEMRASCHIFKMWRNRRSNDARNCRILALRSRMAAFCQALHDFLFLDVIHTSNRAFLESLQNDSSYPSVRLKHEAFVQSLMEMTFRRDRPVSALLNRLLGYCMEMAYAVPDIDEHQLNGLHEHFERAASLLHTILVRKSSLKTSHRVDRLLTRFDFNHFESATALRGLNLHLARAQNDRRNTLTSRVQIKAALNTAARTARRATAV